MTQTYGAALAAYAAATNLYHDNPRDPRTLATMLTAYDNLAFAAPSPERHTPKAKRKTK